MIFKPMTSMVLAVTLLAACADMEDNPKQTAGTLIGAGLGGLLGSQIGSGKGQMVAVGLGVLGGAWLGSETGKSLDKADKTEAGKNAQNTLEYNPSGQSSTWSNPDSGNSGTFTPTKTYQTASGENCREFETTINVDGSNESATGRACRQPDGTWKIIE